jgi:hypothetical protein
LLTFQYQACQLVGNGIGVALLWTGESTGVDGVTPDAPSDPASESPSTALLFYTFLAQREEDLVWEQSQHF